MDIGVLMPIDGKGWTSSATSPQYRPSFDLDRIAVQKAEGIERFGSRVQPPMACRKDRLPLAAE